MAEVDGSQLRLSLLLCFHPNRPLQAFPSQVTKANIPAARRYRSDDDGFIVSADRIL